MAALKALDADEERDEARPELDPDQLDALAAVLERSASWFPAPANVEPAPISESSSPPKSAPDADTAPPESRVRASARPLGKKERRELERKQHVLAAQRANQQRRERQKKRQQLRAQRLAARKPAAQPKIAVAKVAPRPSATLAATPLEPARRGWRVPWAAIAIVAIAAVLAWLLRKL